MSIIIKEIEITELNNISFLRKLIFWLLIENKFIKSIPNLF